MSHKPQTILFGNGLNRLSPDCPSWDDLLRGINANAQRCVDFEKIPFTFQYEILLPDDHYTQRVVTARGRTIEKSYIVPDNAEKIIKERICERLAQMKPNPFYERLAKLDVQNYLTTNYEYLLHDAIARLYSCQSKDYKRERRYSIRRRTSFQQAQKPLCNVWSIHGEIDKPESLMLGLDHYGESVSRIEEYIKGKADLQDIRYDSIEKRLQQGTFSDENSWIDLFFCTDVHIVGLGLDYSENDIWWLLSRRMRIFKKFNGEIKPNNIYYYGQLDPDKAHLLQKFGVHYVEVKIACNDYQRQYEDILTSLEMTTGYRHILD